MRTTWGDVAVTPGLLDEHAVRNYSTGGCAALALALHERTGWTVVAALWGDDEEFWGAEEYAEALDDGVPNIWPSHVMVRTPDDDLLDIRGLRSYRQYNASFKDGEGGEYNGVCFVDVDEAHARLLVTRCPPQDPALAASFVEPVLALAAANVRAG